ncbi:MAG: peptidylprolyl isomerase [Opitutus sp.]|nr:peptidylprolyl isomerase [Opitutus sp.]
MRKFGILIILAGVLIFIAIQARTGIFRRANPGEPANKWVREQQEAQRLSPEDIAQIKQHFADATVTPSGLRYVVQRPGEGSPPSVGAMVVAHYHGTLLGGQKFDSSYDRNEPFSFRVGTGAVIKGWDEAFAAMKKGEKRTLIIPWWLAYGTSGKGAIPPRATLVFEVEVLDIR